MSDDYTQAARAEAERRYPNIQPRALAEAYHEVFVAGAEWAAGRAETPAGLTVSEDGAVLNWRGVNYVPQRAETTTACTCDAAPAEIGGASHRPGCGEPEMTTATTEDAEAAVVDALGQSPFAHHEVIPSGETASTLYITHDDEWADLASLIVQMLTARGLLATARTRPTRTVYSVQHWEDADGIRAGWVTGYGGYTTSREDAEATFRHQERQHPDATFRLAQAEVTTWTEVE